LPARTSFPCTTGYCHISNLSDERLPKLDAAYKVGTSVVRCRVIGFQLVDGLASMSARKAVVEQQVCLQFVWGRICLWVCVLRRAKPGPFEL